MLVARSLSVAAGERGLLCFTELGRRRCQKKRLAGRPPRTETAASVRCAGHGPPRRGDTRLKPASERAGGRCQAPSDVDPQPDGQQVGQQQRRQEDLEELRREDAALLHDARVAHAERGRALWVLEEQEFLGRGDVLWPTGPIPNPV